MPDRQTHFIESGETGIVIYDMDRGDYIFVSYNAVEYLIAELEKLKGARPRKC